MRDKRWVAIHRGGLLTPDMHRQLMVWACSCAERVLPLYPGIPDERIVKTLATAEAWTKGQATVGEARNAAAGLLQLARILSDPVSIAVIRAVMHAVATAHMADHALGSALYAIKAIRLAGLSPENGKNWQHQQLTPGIRDLVTETRAMKEKGSFKV